MRSRMVIGGAAVMVMASLGLFAPIYYDGHSISYMSDQCLTLQGTEGFLELLIFSGDPDQCQAIRQITLALYGVGSAGLIALAAGLVTRR